MTKVAIIQCTKIKDASCVACLKCFKGADQKNGEFSRYDSVSIAAMCGCGDCPGLVMPKAQLMMDMADYMDCDVDAIHLGTCMVKAKKTATCPIDHDVLKEMLHNKFGRPVVVGTHNY